jgi:hypothetical protein
MARSQTRDGINTVLFRGIALFVLLLIAGLGYLQAVHVHKGLAPEPGSARAHCSLCVVTHNAVVVTVATDSPVPLVGSGSLAITDPQIHSRLTVATAFIRPPPPQSV